MRNPVNYKVKVQQRARILIVLPTLGQRPKLLRQTLESIANQAPTLADIVMIFPNKDKQVKQIAKEYNAIEINDPGAGLSAAVNLGITQAKSYHEFIGWIGDDDLIAPKSLEIATAALDKNSEAVLAFGYCDYIDSEGRKILTSRAGRMAPWIMTWGPNLMPCPGTLFRYSALKKAGPFDVNNRYSMDLDMFLRLRKQGKFINTRTVLASFRWHPDSTTVANRSKVLRETEKVKRKYLPKYLQVIAPLWEIPVRVATLLASARLNRLARVNKNRH